MFANPVFRISTVAVALLVQLGCQNSKPSEPQAAARPRRALVASGGNGGNITVFLPSTDPANPVVMTTAGAKVCPECRAAAIKYLQTGELDPKCSLTGATRTPAFGSATSDLILKN